MSNYQKLITAERFVDEARFDEALNLYAQLYAAFQEENYDPFFALVSNQMKQLILASDLARETVINWRTASVERLLASKRGENLGPIQWYDEMLCEHNFTFNLFKAFEASGASESELHSAIWQVWQLFVEEGHYLDIQKSFTRINEHHLFEVAQFRANSLFPVPERTEFYPDVEQKRLLKAGLLLFELSHALQELDAANLFERKILKIDCGSDTISKLLDVAKRLIINAKIVEFEGMLSRAGTHPN